MGTETCKTTIIIGAGASEEVGLPIGSRLKVVISDVLDIRQDEYEPRSAKGQLIAAAQHIIRSGKNPFLQSFGASCQQIRSGLPLAPSIDNYLHTHAGNPSIEGTAKLGITAAILDAERSSKIFPKPLNRPVVDFAAVQNTWFAKLLQILMTCDLNELKRRLSEITVISFNYDRCFEYFVHSAIQSFYSISAEEASKTVRALRIYHPYGQVGFLPWQTNDAPIDFGASCTAVQLADISSQIKTFTEGTTYGSSEIALIRKAINECGNLIFLGFAFHPINMELLTYRGNSDADKKVFGTAYEVSPHDLKIINDDIRNLTQGAYFEEVNLVNKKCGEFMDYFKRSLTAACT